MTKTKELNFWIPKKQLEELRRNYPDRYFEDAGIVIGKKRVRNKRWKHLGENDVALTFVEYESLDALLRFLSKYYPEKHWEEKEKIEDLQERIKNLNKAMGRWTELSSGEKISIASGLEGVADELPQAGYARDQDKIEGRDRLRNCSALIRNKGLNPGAIRAILVGALFNLDDRLETMNDIRKEYEFRRILAEGIRDEFGKKFKKAKTKCQGLKNSLRNKSRKQLHKIRSKIGYEFNLLRNTTTKPYTQYVERVDYIITQDLRKAINEKNLAAVMKYAEEIKELADEVFKHIEEQRRKSEVQ